jgi:nicotinamide-nucleotide amidase
LLKTFSVPAIVHRIVRTAGIGESFLAGIISSWENSLPSHIKLAYLPGVGGVKLGLTAIGENQSTLKKEIDNLIEAIMPLAGEYVYSVEDENLEEVVGKLLRARRLTISIAESCTGGYVSHLITSVPGSSEYFLGSIIPYAYEIKMRQLGVKPETLEMHGAVSEPTIVEMANLVRAKFNTDIGVATSGIAGPGGATLEKPVGTVWIAYSDKHHTVTRKLQLSKDRMINIQLASMLVLNLIRLSVPKE